LATLEQEAAELRRDVEFIKQNLGDLLG